jgi:two-component system, OmpR family, response regulator
MGPGSEAALKQGQTFRNRSGGVRILVVVARSARVTLVEDETAVREAVAAALAGDGFVVSAFTDFAKPEEILGTAPDLAVLDVVLPGGDGFELALRLRACRDLPVIFLTARDAVEDRLAGFHTGADDYLVKPFALEELLARVRAVLRRGGLAGDPLVAGDVLVDEHAGLARRSGHDLGLTSTELRLLSYLVRHRGMVLSKPQLLSQVWGYDAYDPNLVEVHISSLRRKLEVHGPRIIDTVHGLGYRVVPR